MATVNSRDLVDRLIRDDGWYDAPGRPPDGLDAAATPASKGGARMTYFADLHPFVFYAFALPALGLAAALAGALAERIARWRMERRVRSLRRAVR